MSLTQRSASGRHTGDRLGLPTLTSNISGTEWQWYRVTLSTTPGTPDPCP